jgi:hypothetical protein
MEGNSKKEATRSYQIKIVNARFFVNGGNLRMEVFIAEYVYVL